MKQIRLGVFETNSSSTHSLTLCSKAEFEAWKQGKTYYNRYRTKGAKFIDCNAVTSADMEDDDDYESFESWSDGGDGLEIFIENYKTESGDEIVAFGRYGYNG